MRKPGPRAAPMAIGVAIATTLAANVAVLVEQAVRPAETTTTAVAPGQLVAAAHGATAAPVAPLAKRVEPQVMVVAKGRAALPADLAAKIAKIKGVTGVQAADGARAKLAGKEVGIFGVDPSGFRNFTPAPTAKHDGLWRNIAAGDVAVSFVLGSDGGVELDSRVPVAGKAEIDRVRVGAVATMGIGDIDAVVSKATARRLGMVADNVLIVAGADKDRDAIAKAVKRVVNAKTGTVRALNPAFDFKGSAEGGAYLSAREIKTAIEAGMTKLGMPYVWGGESDAEGGYDCSGLLQWAFAQAGVRLPRVAEDQARTGPIVPFEQARVGDLLIWANDPTAPGRISHIALYLGGDKMLVAPRTGDVIKIQKVYFNGFRGAVRVNRQAAARAAG
ncbi:C40 family peptidase [Actinocorallia sp. A-T 12471]|uniref:C40 family peptidase n=1 Tax=Actinocorallia sp. A-T 12471 TaxID=3089813 RepID=UPI0029CD55F6|nr:C40 family peptidase [Actinocorallia sp. A-T 12471]MDX6738580.1 C40 family peptidase [Actinocorallia sp. A-T 12471]